MSDIADTLRDFLQAYPEDIFPTPPAERQARNAAAAHVIRELAYPAMERALNEIERLRAEIEDCKLADIVSRNPGIDIEAVRRFRATGVMPDELSREADLAELEEDSDDDVWVRRNDGISDVGLCPDEPSTDGRSGSVGRVLPR